MFTQVAVAPTIGERIYTYLDTRCLVPAFDGSD